MRVCGLNFRTLGLVSLGSRQWRSLWGDWFLAVILSLTFTAVILEWRSLGSISL